MTNLGMVASFEERSDSHKTILVIPHDGVWLCIWITWNLEGVMENCYGMSGNSTAL